MAKKYCDDSIIYIDMKEEVIPENEKGKELNLDMEIMLSSEEKAKSTFSRARHKLLHPLIWKPMTGNMATDFKVPAPGGEVVDTPLVVGDYITIDIPGPKLSAGDGHDWVKVKKVEDNVDPQADESFALTVEVCENPEHPEKGVAHFFAAGATSTFIIVRSNQKVTASYYGRNETTNFDSPALGDKIRNAVIAIGAKAGVSELQWNSFLKGLLGDQES